MARLYFEDLDVGQRFEFDSVTLEKSEIVEFAERWDPQPFHVDEERAAESIFGGLVASGLHTFCASNVLATEAFFEEIRFMAGRGVDDLRWLRPVSPGDTLTGFAVVRDLWPSESHADRGYATVEMVGTDDDGDRIISWTALPVIERRRDGENE